MIAIAVRPIVKRGLMTLLLFLIMHSVLLALLYGFTKDMGVVWFSFFLFPVFLLFPVMRSRVHHPPVFLLLHVAMSVWPLFLPITLLVRLFVALFMLIGAAVSVSLQMKGEWTIGIGCTWLALLFDFVFILVAPTFGIVPVTHFFVANALAGMVAAAVYSQMARVDDVIELTDLTTVQPIGSILRFNNRIALAVVVMIGLSVLFPLQGALSVVLLNGGKGLLWLSVLTAKGFEAILPHNRVEGDEPVGQATHEGVHLPAPGKTSTIIPIVEHVVFYLLVTAIIVGILWCIFRLLSDFSKRFGKANAPGADQKAYIGPELRLGHGRDMFRKGSWLFGFGLDETMKIRRRYYKKIKKYMKNGVPIEKSDTTGEILQKVGEQDELEPITRLYEEARYGTKTNMEKF